MATDPRIIIDDNPMSVRQWIVVALMVALNALDGLERQLHQSDDAVTV